MFVYNSKGVRTTLNKLLNNGDLIPFLLVFSM